jgi:hypothetical protein
MHKGIFAHDFYVRSNNLSYLDKCSFVFLSIDSGNARREITTYLINKEIPFIDVGLGIETLDIDGEETSLRGSCRATLVTPDKHDHVENSLTFIDDDHDLAIYESNIQIADMNSMNAVLAVSRWKQFKGFYHDGTDLAHNLTYTISFQSISRSENV